MYYNKHNWVNTTALLAITLEDFLADNLFKSDLSRAVYASEDYVYRRRFELMDSSRKWENIEASSLQFPFFSYHVDNNWAPIQEKRVYTLEEYGVTSASQQGNLRIIQVQNPVSILLHYDREDDARFAYDKLSFMSSQKRWYTQQASYLFDNLEIPFSFTIDSSKVEFSPKVSEMDWLKQNRLFVLSFEVVAESLLLFPPLQYEDDSNFTPEPFSISEEVLLDFTSGKSSSVTSVEDVFADNTIRLDSFVLERSTRTTAKFSWSFTDQDTFDEIVLRVNGKSYELTSEDYIYTIRGLLAGAEYQADLSATKGAHSKCFSLRFSTVSVSSNDKDVVGTTW